MKNHIIRFWRDSISIQWIEMTVILGLLLRERDLWLRNWKTIPLRFVLQPATQISVFASILSAQIQISGSAHYASIVGPGIVVMSVINFCVLNVSNNIMIGYTTRLFESWLCAPISAMRLLLTNVLSASLNGFVAGIVVIVLLWCITGTHPEALILSIISVLLLSFWVSVATTIAFLAPETPDRMQNIMPYFLVPATSFGCIFYTYSSQTDFQKVISLIFPTTYFSEMIRLCFGINSGIGSYGPLFIMMLTSLAALLLVLRWAGLRRLGDYVW